METTLANSTALILAIALVISIIATQFVRRRPTAFPLRTIPAFNALPALIGASVEADRPIHVSWGSAALGGNATLLTLAANEWFYSVARSATTGTRMPLLTMSQTSALALGYGTLRQAYTSRERMDRVRRGSVMWLPAGERALGFAAALTVLMNTDQVSGNVLVGSFGAELALILDANRRRRTLAIAASDQLEGQAVAYVLAQRPLLGEEIYAAGAYLNADEKYGSAQVGGIVALDVLRWLLIVGLLGASALVLREPLAAALTRALAGG